VVSAAVRGLREPHRVYTGIKLVILTEKVKVGSGFERPGRYVPFDRAVMALMDHAAPIVDQKPVNKQPAWMERRPSAAECDFDCGAPCKAVMALRICRMRETNCRVAR